MMDRRPLAHQSFMLLWKILFLIVMELGIRNDLVEPDSGTPQEEGEEEDEPTHDPEIVPSDHDDDNDEPDNDGSDPALSDHGHEPEAELNPKGSDAQSKSDEPLGGHARGGLTDGVNDSVKDVVGQPMGTREDLVPGEMEVNMDADLAYGDTPLYNPFDRPIGEIIVQACSPSRSRSPRRSRSVQSGI